MPRISFRPIMATLIVIVVLILPAALAAQSFWLERSPGKTFLLEIFKPNISSGVYNGVRYPVDYSFETFALFLSLRWPMGSKYFLVAELPFAHAAFDTKIDRAFSFYRFNGHSNTIGNPYLGLERGSFEIGLRLPLAKTDNNYAAPVGMAADVDRREAFESYAALRATVNYQAKRLFFWKLPQSWALRYRFGAIILRNFDHFRDNYFAFPLNFQIGYQTARIQLGINNASWIGALRQYRDRIQSSFTRDSDFTIHAEGEGGFTASIKFGNLRPGLYIGSSFGLNLNIQR